MMRSRQPQPTASLALALITLAAALVRVPGFLNHPVVLTEGTTYVTIARNLLAGHGYVGILGEVEPFAPPLYPLLIALVAALSGDALGSARLISLLAGVALVPASFLLAAWLFDRRAGLWAALLVAGAPLLIEYSSLEWSETLYALLLVLGLAWGWRTIQSGQARHALIAGLCLGLAYLTRVEGALALALVAAWLTLRRWAAPRPTARRDGRAWGRQMVALVGAFALVAAPYVLWLSLTLDRVAFESKSNLNFVIAGRMAQGQSYVDAAYGLDAEGRPWGVFLERTAQLSQPPAPDVAPLWSAGRLRQLVDGLRGVRQELQLYLVSPLFLAAIAVGVLSALGFVVRREPSSSSIGADRAAGRTSTLYLGSFLGLALLTVAMVPLVYTRYLFPLWPLLAAWAGKGLAWAEGGSWAVRALPSARVRTALTVAVSRALAAFSSPRKHRQQPARGGWRPAAGRGLVGAADAGPQSAHPVGAQPDSFLCRGDSCADAQRIAGSSAELCRRRPRGCNHHFAAQIGCPACAAGLARRSGAAPALASGLSRHDRGRRRFGYLGETVNQSRRHAAPRLPETRRAG